jgi:hypothetical protein
MNFIHAVDGTEARGNSVNEEIDRDCIFSEGRGSPQRLADSQKKEIRRLPKKGVSDSLRKWCKLGLICSEILYKSSRFDHPLNPQDSSSLSSSTPLRTPSLGCASEGVGYRFPVLVQGHRAHAAPIANAKAAAGAVHGCGTPRAPETRRLHRWRG